MSEERYTVTRTPVLPHTPNGVQLSQPEEHLRRWKAYSRLVQCIVGACAALYELTTGEEAPKFRDVMRG